MGKATKEFVFFVPFFNKKSIFQVKSEELKMKILYIAPASVNHTVRWVNAMVEKDHEVYLLSLKEHLEGKNKIDSRVKIYYLPIGGMLGYYLNTILAKKIIKNVNPDLINTHYASGYGTLSRLVDYKPTLLSVWGSDVYDFPNENKLKRNILEKNLKNAFKIASTSHAMAKETNKYIQERIYVTPFGVDINLFRKTRGEKCSEVINIGLVKTLKPKYGVKYLIEGISLLTKKLESEKKFDILKKLSCNIYGEGEEKEMLQNLTSELRLNNIIKFKGYIENIKVPEVINKMDIFCAPSVLDSESFGVAAVEAMACEVPVIVSDVDGFKEVVENNKTGYIVPRRNPQVIADKLFELIIDEEKRREFGINGRRRVEKLYDWSKNVNLMEEVYSKVVRKWENEK